MDIYISLYRIRIGTFHGRALRQKGMSPLTTFELTTWLAFLILQISGDIEINPGPNSNESSMSSNVDLHGIFKHKLSIVHLNVQSLHQKTDIIQAELDHFDIIALTETWLNDTIDNNDLALTQYHPPIRRIVLLIDTEV